MVLNDPAVTNSILVAMCSGLVSGVAVALLNYLLDKKKTDAEIQNINAQASKAKAETEKIVVEMTNVSAAVSYALSDSSEMTLINGKAGLNGFDVDGVEGQYWNRLDDKAIPMSPKAQGRLTFEDGVLNVERTNTAGKFELIFRRYQYKGREHELIPKDTVISGQRKLLASCEAKAVGGEHILRFIIREPKTGRRLAQSKIRVLLTSGLLTKSSCLPMRA